MNENAVTASRLFEGEEGYTLIELIAVIAIIGILAGAVAMRQFSSTSSVQLSSAIDVIVNDLQYAQDLATAHGKPIRIDLDPARNSYQVVWDDGSTAPANPSGEGDFIREFGAHSTFGQIMFSNTGLPRNFIEFGSDGTPSIDGQKIADDVDFVIINQEKAIKIAAHTGKIRVDAL